MSGSAAGGAGAWLLRQYDTAWRLTALHLDSLTTAECLWRPARRGLHVWESAESTWHADWPTHEGYDLGPPSIAWLTWHISFWWSMVLDHTFGDGTRSREHVTWPGGAAAVRDELAGFDAHWRAELGRLSAAALQSPARTRWPFRNRPLADVLAWVNLELTKNAAEIGYARFLYAAAHTPSAPPAPR